MRVTKSLVQVCAIIGTTAYGTGLLVGVYNDSVYAKIISTVMVITTLCTYGWNDYLRMKKTFGVE